MPSQHSAMADVMTSLSVTPPLPSGQHSGTGGQDLTPVQLQQIMEQIEVSMPLEYLVIQWNNSQLTEPKSGV